MTDALTNSIEIVEDATISGAKLLQNIDSASK